MDISKILKNSEKKSYLLEKIFFNISVIMIGFLSSRIMIMGNYPLGASLVSSSSGLSLISAVIGSSLGYFSAPNIGISIRYISSLVSICAMKMILGNTRSPKKSSFITFLPIFITGLSFKIAYGLSFRSFVECLLESFISSAISYVLRIGFLSESNRSKFIFPVFSFIVIIFSITNLNLFSLNLSNIILIFLSMIFSQTFKVFGGSLFGILHGTLYMMSSPCDLTKATSAPFAGTASGLFSKFGKIYIIFSYIICDLIIKFQLNSKFSVSELIEQIIASIFFFISCKYFNSDKYIIKFDQITDGIKSLMIQNVLLIKNSFVSSKKLFDKTSDLLDKDYDSDSKKFLKSYLTSVSQICKNIIDDININFEVNEDVSLKIKKMIKRVFNVNAEVNFSMNNLKKSIIQIEFLRFDIQKNLDALEEEIYFICKKSFMKPEIFENEKSIIIKFCEKTQFRPQVIAKQHICDGEKNCGDCYCSFFDGLGNFYVIISDGMGKGNLASISGNMVAKIIKNMLRNGVNIETVIFVTNFVLIEKSREESLATLDLLKINLFTGKSFFIKLGSSSSFIKSGNNVTKVPSNCPPIGILPEIKLDKIHFTLKENDIILMVSDGVTDTGEEWVEKLILNEITDINLSSKVLKIAKQKRESDDDITALSIKIIK